MLYMEAVMMQVWRHTWRPWSCKLGGRVGTGLELHLKALIERVWRCTWRLWLCEIGGRNGAGWETHMVAVIEWIWRCNWRPQSSEIGGALGGGQSGGGILGDWRHGTWDSIYWLIYNCENVESWVQYGLPRDWLGAGDSRSWGAAVHSICSTQYMLYSLYAVLGVCGTRCWLWIMAWRNREQWHDFAFLGDGRVDDGKERDDRRCGKSSWETGTWVNFMRKSMVHSRYSRYDS